ncbi:unnamed protein product [Alopecurus aequalis]
MQAFARLSSAAASRRVISGVSGVVTRPCYRTWRGKAHAAPLSSQDSPKGQKREWISKKERKARIEDFVEIYQTSNDGKFPTIQMIRQHVGGGHYTIREVLQEVKYNQMKFPFDKSKVAQFHETAECAEQSSPQEESGNSSSNPQSFNGKQDADADESIVSEQAEIDGTKEKMQLDDSKAAWLHETADCAEHSRPKEVGANSSFNPQNFSGKQDQDDTLLSQKDSTTGTNEPQRSLESQDSSHYNGETETAKQDLCTADANDPAVSKQAEIDSMKIEAPISLELDTKSDSENRQGETEVNKLQVNNVENFQNPSEPTVSDQTESGKVIKGNVLDREDNPEVEQQGSAKTSLLGSLKSLASGIRNFWRNL